MNIPQASCLASSPSSHTVAVGTLTGHVFLLDLSNLENPRVVQRLHMHQSPVQQLVFDEEGRYLLTGADDGHVFVVDARPSSGFKILGQTRESQHFQIQIQFVNISLTDWY